MFKKGLSVLLSIIMTISLFVFLPFSASAEEKDATDTGVLDSIERVPDEDIAPVPIDKELETIASDENASKGFAPVGANQESAEVGGDDYPYSGTAAGVYIVDDWNFYRGECTSFCAWRLNHNNGVGFSNWYGGIRWGNANTWDDAARNLGITVNNTPAVGSIAYWEGTSGSTGHVAWVSNVYNGSVDIEEYNYGWVVINGEYHGNHKYCARNIGTGDPSGYIHIKDINPIPTPQGHVMSESEGAGRTIPDGDYWICSEVAQDFFLDIPGDSALKEGGANVEMWIWGNKMPTKYDVFHIEYLNNGFYTISQLGSKYSLDVNSGNLERGTNVIMWDSHGGNPQQWSIEKTDHGYAIRARCNNYYLDVSESGKYEKGQNVLVWEGHGGNNQHFSFIPYAPDERPIEDGVYTIWSNVSEPLFLDASGNPGSFANNTNIQIWNSTGTDYINKVERYKVEYVGDGYYRLFEATSGLSVEIMLDDQSYMIKNKNAVLFGKTANRGQLWKIRKNSDGTFFLFNKLAGQCLDLCDAGTTNGTNVFAHPYNGSNAQKWKFRRVLTEEMVNVSGWIMDNGFYKPVISVTLDGKELELNKDYTVDLSINNDILYANIEGVGNYSGIISIPYEKQKNNIGDTDCDGYITISDVTEIQKHLAELIHFSNEQLALADTDGDGKIDIGDATHLQKYLAEFDGIVLGKQVA